MSGSVWFAPAGPARRAISGPTTSPEDLARTAVAIADAQGLPAVTVRSVAEALGVTSLSLYAVVKNRDQIIELMINRLFWEQEPSHGRDWRELLRNLGRANRRRYTRHPWLSSVSDRAAKVPGPDMLAHYDTTMAALLALQPTLTLADLSTIIAVLAHVSVGSAATPFLGPLSRLAEDAELRDYVDASLADGTRPTMASFRGQFAAFTKDRFDDELEIIVNGLASLFA